MELQKVHTINAPNIYSLNENIVQISIKLGELVDVPTKAIKDFNQKIFLYFPGIFDHKCSLGCKGGFAKRLVEGTYISHVIEHLCLELESMLGYNMKFGKARQVEGDVYNIIYACPNGRIGEICAYFIFDLVNQLIIGADFDFKLEFENLKRRCSKFQLGPSTAAILNEAKSRGIPVSEIDYSGIIRMGYGKYQQYFSSTIVEDTSCISVDMSCDKALTKFLLNEVAIPVPIGAICYSEEEAVALCQKIGYPIVMKPKSGNHGKLVFIDIKDEYTLREAFRKVISFDKQVLIEKLVTGKDFRLLVVNGKFIAASERVKAHVIGDGKNSIQKLIEITNSDEERGDEHEKPLTKIKIDDDTKMLLTKQNVQLTFVPSKGQVIWLKGAANLSTGGIAIDCTDLVHIKNREYAVKAANCLGLHIAGIDIVASDISKPINGGFGAIVEVNAAPGLRMHIYPSYGKSRDVVSPILDMLYPKEDKYSIPIVSITGTNGKTTTNRMISHILRTHGLQVGQTTTGGIFIGNECIEYGDTTGYISAKRVLNNRKIDVAVLETARGGIIRQGLGYEKADIAVFTNLSEDHLGLDNVNTMDELFYVKSLVIEAVKDTGFCILNADDGWIGKAMERARGKKILISLYHTNEIIRKHLLNGGSAIYKQMDFLYYANSYTAKEIMKINDIPATINGNLKNNIYNSLCAIGACIALNIPFETIISAMKTFESDTISNPGRFNVFEMNGYKIVLDYGHNYDGYQSTIECLKAIHPNRIIGVIGVPGDRRDEDIIKIAAISAQTFDKIIIKEDRIIRDRKPMDVATILYNAVIDSGISPNQVEIILDEEKALTVAIESAKEGDCILMFYEEFEPAIKIINRFKDMEYQKICN